MVMLMDFRLVKLTLKDSDLVIEMDLRMVKLMDWRLVKRMRLVIVKDWQTD